MITFRVTKMSCGGCVKHVTKAIQSIDPMAQVNVDLTSGEVTVTPTPKDPLAIETAITAAGYPAEIINS
ncbi:MAG: copper chaperone [Methylocystaceae bacterium]|jgi:copper chaperone CopZ|nr:copper chaperone [Methylocystaceae bacterium]